MPVFGEEVMVEEAAAEESMEAEALPMMMSEEPALLSETGEAEPPAPRPDLTEEQRAALAFDTMDTDGNGELSAEEIHRVLSGYDSASLERVQEIVSRADADGNGLVSKQEYLDAIAADIVPRGWLGTWLGWTVSRLAAAFGGEAMPEAAPETAKMVKCLTNEELRDWVRRWCRYDRAGLPHISTWNTSKVTDMSWLFNGEYTFNDDISAWDTSNVTNMRNMFWMPHKASSFNQPLNDWRVDNVTRMDWMFNGASAFNQPLNDWRVDRVTTMGWMFHKASSFNQPLNDWRVDNVTNMSCMFWEASSFNQPLGDWRLRAGCNTKHMFAHTKFRNSRPVKEPCCAVS